MTIYNRTPETHINLPGSSLACALSDRTRPELRICDASSINNLPTNNAIRSVSSDRLGFEPRTLSISPVSASRITLTSRVGGVPVHTRYKNK